MLPIVLVLALVLWTRPALAEWECQIERSYECNRAGECDRVAATARVTLNDDKLTFRSCLVACVEGPVTLRRNFFGSTYRHVESDNSVRTMLRSRSGEYSEHTLVPDGTVTSVAMGVCAWR